MKINKIRNRKEVKKMNVNSKVFRKFCMMYEYDKNLSKQENWDRLKFKWNTEIARIYSLKFGDYCAGIYDNINLYTEGYISSKVAMPDFVKFE